VEHVLRIYPNDAVIHLDPLKRVSAKALGYLIGVRVKLEAKRFPIFATEHDHARHEEESTQQSPPKKGAESRGAFASPIQNQRPQARRRLCVRPSSRSRSCRRRPRTRTPG